MLSCLIRSGSECYNNLFNLVIREIFSSLYVKKIRERGCGFAVVNVVAVVSLFVRGLFCLHVVAFSQVQLLGV